MLKDVINEFKYLEFQKQKNTEIKKYFHEELKCENVPDGVIEFYKEYDGCRLSINDIFSIQEIKNELSEYFVDFLGGMGIDYSKNKYVPIANDGMGGYYAFLSNSKEEMIYYLDHEFPDEIQTYENFEDFLNDICSMDAEL